MYYLTVKKNDIELFHRKPFDDYIKAMDFCANYFDSNYSSSVLKFTTEMIGGKFAKTYAELNLPAHIDPQGKIGEMRYHNAIKQSSSFKYDASYFFLIESEWGIEDINNYQNDNR